MNVLAAGTLSVAAYSVLPYVALAVGIGGLIWRKKTDRFGWTARSTELLESRVLRYASVLFHFGVLAAIGGHVLGILIPQSWTEAIGLSEEAYHVLAVVGGISAGFAVVVGFAALMYRRVRFPRVRVTTTRMDVVTFVVLGVAIATGMLATLINIPDTVHYRESVAPYFRQIFILDPEPSLMEGVNWVFQTHVIVVWFLYALWPFSRLIHAFTVPVGYIWRSPIVYRPRGGRSGARTGTYGSGAPDYSPSIPSSRTSRPKTSEKAAQPH
ncbi:MAG: Respiratory nitrate reductase subunit gamma [Actinomycetota bacterium]|jgi:nitrate reductase gamma subunit|nr:Respiratory nitrate reductase subunit gamma [Actinomycetota bacterium]